jgi:hypothetical protein
MVSILSNLYQFGIILTYLSNIMLVSYYRNKEDRLPYGQCKITGITLAWSHEKAAIRSSL